MSTTKGIKCGSCGNRPTVKATLCTRDGRHPVQYRRGLGGEGFERMNPAGRWVTLDPNYPEHANAYRAAKHAIEKAGL